MSYGKINITTLTAFIARSPATHPRNAPERPHPLRLRLIATLDGRIAVGPFQTKIFA